MRNLIFFLTFITTLISCGQDQTKQKKLELKEREIAIKEKELVLKQANSPKLDDNTKGNQIKPTEPTKEKMRDEKWQDFFQEFKDAIAAKDKTKIASLTSKDFFDGGGGETITEWLNTIVFVNNQNFNDFKKSLNSGVKNYKNQDGSIYKATGKSEYGDLYFDYKGGKWLFGGVVGD